MSKQIIDLDKGSSIIVTGAKGAEKINIDALKEVANFSVRFGKRLARVTADGEIVWYEKISLGITFTGVVNLIPLHARLVKELDDLDEAEYNELLDIIQKGLKINVEPARKFFKDFIATIELLETTLSFLKSKVTKA